MATHSSVLAWRIPMDRVAWWAIVHGVEKSQTQVSDKAQHSINITVSSILFLGETWQFSFHLVHHGPPPPFKTLVGSSVYSIIIPTLIKQ